MTLVFGVMGAYVLRTKEMPLLTNVIYDLGLGPAALHDAYVDLGLGTRALHDAVRSIPTAGPAFWAAVTFVGFLGAVVLVQATLLAIGKTWKFLPVAAGKRELLVILLAGGLIYLVPVSILTLIDMAFDRYVLWLVPLGIVILFLLASDVGPAKAGSLTNKVARSGEFDLVWRIFHRWNTRLSVLEQGRDGRLLTI
jgi:hypothetical protein